MNYLTQKQFPRRAFLRGVGATVALPFLDAMVPAAAGRSPVEVRNDGPVLPPEAVGSLLEPFQRLDRGARGDGVGLGLSIVRSVAEAHGGAVELRARPSGGLVARVSLPGRDGATIDEDLIQREYADDRARAHA